MSKKVAKSCRSLMTIYSFPMVLHRLENRNNYLARVTGHWQRIETLLQQASKKQLLHSLMLSFALWAMVLLMYYALNRHDPSSAFVALVFLLLALVLLALAFTHNRNALRSTTRFLFEQADDVVWIYYHKMNHLPFGLQMASPCTLVMGDRKGDLKNIHLPEAEIIELMNALRLHLPHAVFGFSRYKEQLYRSSPSLLSKEKHDEKH